MRTYLTLLVLFLACKVSIQHGYLRGYVSLGTSSVTIRHLVSARYVSTVHSSMFEDLHRHSFYVGRLRVLLLITCI
jgi:hypothetical protein